MKTLGDKSRGEKTGVKILSLFDGMACGMIAMQLADVEVESYDAYEIDKYAIKTAQHNFPMIKEHGDVFDADFTQYEGVDFLIGGSPCTYWSIAQTKNRETVASGMGWELFSQYVRALHEAKPKYFIYENNKSMSKQIRASIDKAFGFEAVLINSALVSAQNRQRLYWVGKRNDDGTYSKVNVEQPADRGILLKDVLDSAVAMREKAHAVIASAGRTTEREFFMKNQGNMVAEPVRRMGNDTKSRTLTANYWKTNARDAFVDCAGGRTMVAEPISYCADKNMEHLMRNFGSKGKIVDEESKTPTLMAAAGMGGGNHIYYADLIAEPINVTADDKSHTLKAQYYKNGIANFVSNDGFDATAVAEPVCLRYERTEEAKRCRKAYEAHEIKHGYNELNELHPRPDGKTNTLTTVLKDNQIMEPVCVAERGRMYCGQPQHYEARTDGKTNTLTSVEKDNRVAEPVACRCRGRVDASGNGYAKYECREDGKSNTLDTNTTNGAMVAEPINSTSNGKAKTISASYAYKGDGEGSLKSELFPDNPIKQTSNYVAEPINVPYDCDVVITENSIRCQRRDKKHSTVQGSHVNFTDGKTQTISPSHIPNVIEPKSCGDLYAIPTMPVKEATAKGYTEIECGDCVDLSMPNSKTRRGRNMADKANCMQTSNDFYQYVGYVIEFDDDGRPIKAIGKDGKEITIYEVKDGKITIKGKQYPIKLKDGFYIIRKLTVSECKRLQTVPEWYEFPVSNSQAYKMLGNGWTCGVIAHLIRSCYGRTMGRC